MTKYYVWNAKDNVYISPEYGHNTYSAATEKIERYIRERVGYAHADFKIKERPDKSAIDLDNMLYELMLRDGTHIKTSWDHTAWYQERKYDIRNWPFIDPMKKEMVTYYDDRGRLVQIKPGKYLAKFFSDKLSSDEITKWADVHREDFCAPPQLHWARTPEEIAAVYSMEATFSSCMQQQHPAAEQEYRWDQAQVHPTSVYGAGDLALAYVVRGTRLIGRALVWEEMKKVGRVYGDMVAVRSCLKAYGIETDSDGEEYDTFEGARILHIPFTNPHGKKCIVAPYIDGMAGLELSADNKFLIITDEDFDRDTEEYNNPATYSAWDASGQTRARQLCPCCNKRSYDVNQDVAIGRNGSDLVFEEWCYGCAEDEEKVFSDLFGAAHVVYDVTKFEHLDIHQSNRFGDYEVRVLAGLYDVVTDATGKNRLREETITTDTGEVYYMADAPKYATLDEDNVWRKLSITDRVKKVLSLAA